MKEGHRTEKTQRIIELAKSGKNVTQISKETGYTFRSVFDTVKRHSIQTIKGGSQEIDWYAVQRLYDNGYSVRECVKTLHISESAFYKAARRGLVKTRTLLEGVVLSFKSGRRNPTVISEAHKATLSRCAKERGLGGDKPTLKFTYRGFRLCSSYEVRVAQCLDSIGIEWVKPKTRFKWQDSNSQWHQYSPDLYLPALHIYLDPKNSYCIKRDTDKISRVRTQNGVDVKIIPVETIERWEANPTLISTDLAIVA